MVSRKGLERSRFATPSLTKHASPNFPTPPPSHLTTTHYQLSCLYVIQIPVLYMWFLQARFGLPFIIINHNHYVAGRYPGFRRPALLKNKGCVCQRALLVYIVAKPRWLTRDDTSTDNVRMVMRPMWRGPWLCLEWKIRRKRIGYCSNTNYVRCFRCADNVDLITCNLTTIACGRWRRLEPLSSWRYA